MAAKLEQLCSLLIGIISETHIEKLNKDKAFKKALDDIKKVRKLGLEFNIEHIAAKHSNFYPLKNCEEIHCFECLNSELVLGKNICEHGKPLSKYEDAHIKYIYSKIQSLENS